MTVGRFSDPCWWWFVAGGESTQVTPAVSMPATKEPKNTFQYSQPYCVMLKHPCHVKVTLLKVYLGKLQCCKEYVCTHSATPSRAIDYRWRGMGDMIISFNPCDCYAFVMKWDAGMGWNSLELRRTLFLKITSNAGKHHPRCIGSRAASVLRAILERWSHRSHQTCWHRCSFDETRSNTCQDTADHAVARMFLAYFRGFVDLPIASACDALATVSATGGILLVFSATRFGRLFAQSLETYMMWLCVMLIEQVDIRIGKSTDVRPSGTVWPVLLSTPVIQKMEGSQAIQRRKQYCQHSEQSFFWSLCTASMVWSVHSCMYP